MSTPNLSLLSLTDQKRLRLQGIDKRARDAFFNGRRKNTKRGNFTNHCCYLCGVWRECEMEVCNHAVCVRVLECCDPNSGKKRTEKIEHYVDRA